MKKHKPNKGFAKKSLGQNFLNSSEVRDGILEHAGDIAGKNILEIGPGLGFLTTSLLKAKANLTAVELDERACELLQKDLGHKDNFTLINDSILDIDLDEVFQSPYAVIANIPYNITNPIIKKLLAETKNRPEFCLLMVQKEVAEKICLCKSPPPRGSNEGVFSNMKETLPNLPYKERKKRSLLSISVEVFAEPEYCFTVDRTCFSPAPRVDSAIMKLTTRKVPLITPELERDFFTVVHAGFNEKRKKLGNHIGKFFGIEASKILGDIDPNKRAEELSIEDWIAMTKRFQNLKDHQ